MELKEAIEKRRTVRDFQNRIIPERILDYAIGNGFKAPTFNHKREWDFIVINCLETKLQLIDAEHLNKQMNNGELETIFKNEEPIMKAMYLDAIPKQQKMILEAPTVVVVVYKPKTRVEAAKRIYDLNCLASVWTCIENFLLSLAEHDVFGVTFIPQHINVIKTKLGIPDELEIAAIIPVGYMAEGAVILKQKTVYIAERKHTERW
jgi:nitroreductase